MSDETNANDGAYIVCSPMVCHAIGHSYTAVVSGKCLECGKPMRNDCVLLQFNQNQLLLDAQCRKCGHVNRVLIATITTLKCEPSSSQEAT